MLIASVRSKTLDRIDGGGTFPHSKDGTVLGNYDGLLPEGNYREFTVDTPGASTRGLRRIVVDENSGRAFYADDHYKNFVEIDRK
jgi:guanyl-specific ribonuclease Sa